MSVDRSAGPALADRRPRLLVITYHYPPDGSVGGLRWGGLSKYLARRGWEVHVVTALPPHSASMPAVPDPHVHYCAPSRTLNDSYNALAARARAFVRRRREADGVAGQAAPASAPAADGARDGTRSGVLGWIRTNLSAVLVFPDYAQGWLLPAARAARALMREHAFDAVVSSGPPHSAHLAATLACWRHPRLLWVDMRDPWAALIEATWSHAVYNSAATRGLVRKLERLAFRRARGVVTNTSEFARDVRDAYPGLTVAYVSNGIDPERLPPRPTAKFAGLSIAYAGTLYLGRDLSPVVHAMQKFLARHPEASGAIRLRVAGSMHDALAARFRTEVAAAGLEEMVEVRGQVPGAEAMDMINRSHLSLVLAQDQPTQIPAKLYECLAMGVQTLVIAEATSAAARDARRIGAETVEASDVDGIVRLLEALWANPNLTVVPRAAISYADIAAEMDALLRSRP